MRGLVTHLRYVCLLQQGARPRDEWAFAPEEIARLQAQANQLSDAQVVRGLDLLADAQVRIRHGGADPRLQLELVAARLSRPALDASAAALDRPRRGPRGRPPRARRRRPRPPPARPRPHRRRPRRAPGAAAEPAAPPSPSRRRAREAPPAPPQAAAEPDPGRPRALRPPLDAGARPARARGAPHPGLPRRLAADRGRRGLARGDRHQRDAGGHARRPRPPRAGADAVASVAGRRMEVAFVAGASETQDPGPESRPSRATTRRSWRSSRRCSGPSRRTASAANRGGRRWPSGMNPQKMLKQMQKMQEDMARVQAELQQESVTASAGGGAVTARVSGGPRAARGGHRPLGR